jgi:hypothetical protein
MNTIFSHLQIFERAFNERYGWFFVNGMKAQDPQYLERFESDTF